MPSSWNRIKVTDYALLSLNPLRKLKFDQTVKPNPDKKEITLQLGDPTIFGNFPPANETVEAFKKAVTLDTFLYNNGPGKLEAREAVVEYSGLSGITSDDVILTSGCNHALEMSILAIVAPGENLLIPRPCYNYDSITKSHGVVTKSYNLDPDANWDIDLKHLESLIDKKTRAIFVNNPGNPCGSLFSKNHILDVLEIAERHKLPIISDEIYERMAFPGVEFHPFASLSKNVPVLTCSGLTKRFLMPGIRLGWIIVSDRNGALTDVKFGLKSITGRILGPNSTVQFALPEILRNTPQKFFDETMERISVSSSNEF